MNYSQSKLIKKDKNRIILTLLLLLILFTFYQNIIAQNNSKEKAVQIKLSKILKKAREYCSRLKHSAFDFVCIEEITEVTDHSRDIVQNILVRTPTGDYGQIETHFKIPKTKEKNKYIYDYQLIRKDYKTKERRILLEENGRKKHKKDAQLKTAIFHYKKVLFGPIDLLSEYWQQHHDYKIVGQEMLNGEKAVVIEAIPHSSLKKRHLFGKIWVKECDFRILKIEWNQKAIGNIQIIEEIAKRYKAEPQITLISEFNIEKNGIRFPSRYFIEEAYVSKKGKKFIRSETTVIYKDYKFFTVETVIKY
ncbi:MAG TPA: hypothetical protein VFG01_10620 [Acidobacteriota bacterium]|nr:hypothetical protein [Acidobacteriota bacterium]